MPSQPGVQNKFYEMSVVANDGKTVPLSKYKGKVVMVVNTASNCGFTPQYKGLEEIYQKYADKGFEILGFPSNDFGKQEPGSDDEIKSFCEINYGVKFPLFKKNPVSGAEAQPLFKFLTEEAHPELKGEVKWNFEKFLIDKKGRLVARYRSKSKPEDADVTQELEKLLAE